MWGYAPGPFQVDYEQRIDFSALRQDIWARVRAAMERHDVDAVFLWRDEHVRYLTGLRVIMIQYRATTTYGVLYTRQGDIVLYVSSGELERVRRAMPWIHEVLPIPIMDEPGLVEDVVAKKVVPMFQRLNLEKARVAIDVMSHQQLRAYQRYLPEVEWVDGDALMQPVRMVKSPQEIALIEEATAIADAVTQAALDAVRAGVRECEVAAEAMRVLFRLGGEFAHLASPFVASGERMAPPARFATDKLIRNGDLVFIDIGACWNGYFGDVGRTMICGKPSPEQKRIYRAVYEAQMAGIAAIRPGVRASQVAAAYKTAAARHGLEEHFIDLFIGHGVGAAPTEPPFVGETMPGANDPVLEPGMVFALEPLIYVEGVRGGGGVRLEDMVLVTDDGARVLSRAPYDEQLLG
ncbi:Xaa-Pro peptidase family protein [Thermaerobacter composti]|uniref:Xaa-Pro peptidase family protein n=1 Tax=Thermaerobacter composti TaxID=554949 RepID=A0ABZ0QM20_9FIRM|nr:Xaa-Pro peptidase family protein [Thermaerobacter composti]WPD18536.1 Xaa-Pro peptidase family protein [Thermaerobacter composti]